MLFVFLYVCYPSSLCRIEHMNKRWAHPKPKVRPDKLCSSRIRECSSQILYFRLTAPVFLLLNGADSVSARWCRFYSHSIVPVGFGVKSYTTRQMPGTSARMRLVIFFSTGQSISGTSAVMASTVLTARMMAGHS